MARSPSTATVCVVLPGGDEVVAGTVSSEGAAGSAAPSLVFRYADSYVVEPRGYDLSPDMPRSSGSLRPWAGRASLGALGDAMPDDWGRRIIRAGTPARTAFDFLVQVNDATRQGAIRIRDTHGDYLANESHPVAEVHDLTRIVAAARAFEGGTETDEELRILVDAGTSAGGARPKAVVRHRQELWMAKFARETEFNDPMAWEATALELARKSGITTAAFELLRLAEHRSVLLTRRFDRNANIRIGYISAHSLTTKLENETLSYAHLADTLAQYSPDPRRDQAELYRRVALSLLIGNVDDHFRNHGFLRRADGWELSPAFDLEPNRRPDNVDATPITEGGEQYGRDIRELLKAHDRFRLSEVAAAVIVREVADATADWRAVANAHGISPEAAEASRRAFEGPNREHAQNLPSSAAAPRSRSRRQPRRGDVGAAGNPGQWANVTPKDESNPPLPSA